MGIPRKRRKSYGGGREKPPGWDHGGRQKETRGKEEKNGKEKIGSKRINP